MKRILTSLAFAALLVATMPSCKKVSPRKLDGKWNVTAGTLTRLNETSSGTSSSRTSTTTTFNGTKETGTSTTTTSFPGGGSTTSETIDRNLTITFEFMKGDDSYTKEITQTGEDTDLNVFGYYTKDANGLYIPFSGQLDIKRSYTEKTIEKGTFSITGGAGDIKKNSQFILQPTSAAFNYNATIKYFTGSNEVSASNLFVVDLFSFSYTPAPTSEDRPSSLSTYESPYSTGLVVTVEELKGGVMDISYKANYTNTFGSTTTTSKDEYTWTLEEE